MIGLETRFLRKNARHETREFHELIPIQCALLARPTDMRRSQLYRQFSGGPIPTDEMRPFVGYSDKTMVLQARITVPQRSRVKEKICSTLS